MHEIVSCPIQDKSVRTKINDRLMRTIEISYGFDDDMHVSKNSSMCLSYCILVTEDSCYGC